MNESVLNDGASYFLLYLKDQKTSIFMLKRLEKRYLTRQKAKSNLNSALLTSFEVGHDLVMNERESETDSSNSIYNGIACQVGHYSRLQPKLYANALLLNLALVPRPRLKASHLANDA